MLWLCYLSPWGAMSTIPPPATGDRLKDAQRVRSGAHWFIWVAGLSLVNTVLFLSGTSWTFFLGLGVTSLADAVGKYVITGTTGQVLALLFDLVIAAIFVGLGLMARKGAQWAFIVGMALIVLDAGLLISVADWGSVAFHALALYFIFRGLQASRRLSSLERVDAVPAGTVPPITPS